MARTKPTDESFTNEFDASLREVKQVSPPLRDLLSESIPSGYDSELKADMGTIAYLRYWRFSEDDICEILTHCRPSQSNDESTRELVQETTLTEVNPVTLRLGSPLVESANRNNGRQKVSVATLQEIQDVFAILGEKTTVSKIVDSGFPRGNATKKRSIKRRVQRGLKLLERAGYVSHEQVGRQYVWYDEDISSLSLPNNPYGNIVESN